MEWEVFFAGAINIFVASASTLTKPLRKPSNLFDSEELRIRAEASAKTPDLRNFCPCFILPVWAGPELTISGGLITLNLKRCLELRLKAPEAFAPSRCEHGKNSIQSREECIKRTLASCTAQLCPGGGYYF